MKIKAKFLVASLISMLVLGSSITMLSACGEANTNQSSDVEIIVNQEEIAESLNKEFQRLEVFGNETDRYLVDFFINGNLGNFTKNELYDIIDSKGRMLSQFEEEMRKIMSNLTEGQLALLGSKIGFSTIDEAVKNMAEKANTTVSEIDALVSDLIGSKQENSELRKDAEGLFSSQHSYTGIGTDTLDSYENALENLTQNQLKIFKDGFNKAISEKGNQTVMTKVFEKIPLDKLGDFSDIMSSIDWENITSSDLVFKLNEIDINANHMQEELRELIFLMDDAPPKSLEELGAEVKPVLDLVG